MTPWDAYLDREYPVTILADRMSYNFPLCEHGLCALDCDDPACEPSLDHEYFCDCTARSCNRHPCTGAYCGCRGCKTAYIDVMSGPA